MVINPTKRLYNLFIYIFYSTSIFYRVMRNMNDVIFLLNLLSITCRTNRLLVTYIYYSLLYILFIILLEARITNNNTHHQPTKNLKQYYSNTHNFLQAVTAEENDHYPSRGKIFIVTLNTWTLQSQEWQIGLNFGEHKMGHTGNQWDSQKRQQILEM